jgi:large subunit ribosomal protein L7/L12
MKALNVMEMLTLTKELQTLFGVSDAELSGVGAVQVAAAPAAAAGDADVAAAAEPVKEKTEFTLKLKGYEDKGKIKVIKEVRAITGLGLKQAKELVESAPCVIKENLKKEEAEGLQKTIADVGGDVELE